MQSPDEGTIDNFVRVDTIGGNTERRQAIVSTSKE